MEEIKKVSVKIQGKEYKINSSEEEEYIEKVAYYLDKKLEQAKSANPSLDTIKVTTLVALNLADSLFKTVKIMERMNGRNGIKSENPIYGEIEKLDKEGIPKEGTEKP